MTRVVVVHGHRGPGRIVISRECVRRVDRAAKLRADYVVFSGAGMPDEKSEAQQMHIAWRGAPGVPAVILESRSTSTVDNARECSGLARSLWATEVVLVTSWWHAPRCFLEWWRRGGGYVLRVRPSRGSWRYVPDEIRALWKAVRHRG